MEKIVNLTQHSATQEQIEQGVFDLTGTAHSVLKELLTFNKLPEARELTDRAEQIANLVLDNTGRGVYHAMIGGAPYLMAPLEKELSSKGIRPLYAFSDRVSVEETQPDGSVRKVNVFRHIGFVTPVQ